MRGDLPPHIDERTDNLDKQRGRDDRPHKVGDVQRLHQIDAEEIAEDGNHVGHQTALLMAQLYQVPAPIAAIEMNQQRGQQDGEDIHHDQHLQLICPRHQGEIAEGEQRHQPHHRQVERRKEYTDHPRGQDYVLFSCHHLTFSSVWLWALPAAHGIWPPCAARWGSPSRPKPPSVGHHSADGACLRHR